jgi:hypothetical protein
MAHVKQQPISFHASPQVVDGYDVVKAIESVGSRSGATSYEVIVADCGALPKGEPQGP